MSTEVLWINEGFMLDDAGNLIMTSYVDLREPGNRTPIRTLVKGCKREHALEDSETIQMSALEKFRAEGENLIRDPQEGLAQGEVVTVTPETPEQALQRRQNEDLNGAFELVDSEMKLRISLTHRNTERRSESLAFGTEWWIVSTAITPENDDEWEAWRATLDPAYNHESVIGQPAKFAEALARMAVEQLGPQCHGATMKSTFGGSLEVHDEPRGRWVIHGPVVYVDSVFEALTQADNEVSRLATLMFIKSASHAEMREYRFVILRGLDGDEKVRLPISGMMRDALIPTTHGLVRVASAPAQAAPQVNAADPTPSRKPSDASHSRPTSTDGLAHQTSREPVTNGSDERTVSSGSGQEEEVREGTVEHDLESGPQMRPSTAELGREAARQDANEKEGPGGRDWTDITSDDEAAVKELAIDKGAAEEEAALEDDGTAVDSGVGKVLDWLRANFNDPAYPTPSASEPWAEEALEPEEVHRMYGFVATLGHKVFIVPPERRQDAASACWHAIQCIRNIFVRLGDIVATASIERGRFVVLELKQSEGLQANGKIVLAPSGAYAYCLKQVNREQSGHGEGFLGKLFFPMASDLEQFESYGWRAKEGPQA